MPLPKMNNIIYLLEILELLEKEPHLLRTTIKKELRLTAHQTDNLVSGFVNLGILDKCDLGTDFDKTQCIYELGLNLTDKLKNAFTRRVRYLELIQNRLEGN